LSLVRWQVDAERRMNVSQITIAKMKDFVSEKVALMSVYLVAKENLIHALKLQVACCTAVNVRRFYHGNVGR